MPNYHTWLMQMAYLRINAFLETLEMVHFNAHLILKMPKMVHFNAIQFSKRPSRIRRPCFDFKNARPASGNRVLIFKAPVPHRDRHFYFSLALSRVGIVIFIFRRDFPASG